MTNINNFSENANNLTIAGTKIKQDADGRFCLNDCHKASRESETKRPGNWLKNSQTIELIKEITDARIIASPVSTIKGGIEQGTYAVKELVYAYAMWISPAFHLKVIRAYDDLINGRLQEPQFAIPKSYSEALRLAADQAEQLKELKPKAEALERIALSDGAFCLTDAAKLLQTNPKKLIDFLSANHWIYRRVGNKNWIAYQDKIQAGYIEHKVTEIFQNDGTSKIREQVKITPKGITKLSKMLSSDMEAA